MNELNEMVHVMNVVGQLSQFHSAISRKRMQSAVKLCTVVYIFIFNLQNITLNDTFT